MAATLNARPRTTLGWKTPTEALDECLSQIDKLRVATTNWSAQYASEAYGRQLVAMKAKPSMSRTACCYDNAPMESFFHTLKIEVVHQRRWATREDARRDLFAYIEGYYNRRRIHSAVGYRTPEQTERNMA